MTTLPSKVRSPNEALDALDLDISSRKRELVNLRQAVTVRSPQPFIHKTAILLAYAHVEGTIKTGLAVLFLRLNASGLRWNQVSPRLAHFEIDRRLARLPGGRGAIVNDPTTAYLRTLSERTIKVDVPDLVGRVGTINRQTLERILAMCHLDATSYGSHLETLDVLLVARRNALAHGEQLSVDPTAAEGAIDTALGIVELLKTDFGNLLALQSYRVAHAAA